MRLKFKNGFTHRIYVGTDLSEQAQLSTDSKELYNTKVGSGLGPERCCTLLTDNGKRASSIRAILEDQSLEALKRRVGDAIGNLCRDDAVSVDKANCCAPSVPLSEVIVVC